jgi:hypothetical protein
VEEVKDLGNAWCAHVAVCTLEDCALEDVPLRLNLRVQRLVAIKFDEDSLDPLVNDRTIPVEYCAVNMVPLEWQPAAMFCTRATSEPRYVYALCPYCLLP